MKAKEIFEPYRQAMCNKITLTYSNIYQVEIDNINNKILLKCVRNLDKTRIQNFKIPPNLDKKLIKLLKYYPEYKMVVYYKNKQFNINKYITDIKTIVLFHEN